MTAHLQRNNRQRKRRADPEPSPEIDQFGLWYGVSRDEVRLQRHAADRAIARTDLADLGVHRTGVDSTFGSGPSRFILNFEIPRRIGDELRTAAGRGEMVGLAKMFGVVGGGQRIDDHAADTIGHPPGRTVRCFRT